MLTKCTRGMEPEYTLRPLELQDAGQYFELLDDWGHTEGHLSDVIEAFAGYVWGIFLPGGKLISV